MGDVIQMGGIHLQPVEPLRVALDYQQLANMLRAASDAHPFEDPQAVDDVLGLAQQGRALVAQVMLGHQELAVLAVEIKQTVGGRVLWIRYCSGENMELWLESVMGWLQEVARSEGCTRIGLMGRKGWVRELSRFGYSTVATQLVCDVEPGNEREHREVGGPE